MTPRHHPSHALILDHAAGTLDAGRSLIVGVHLASCAHCRVEVGLAEAVGGALMAEASPAALSPDALARALAQIERPDPDPPKPPVAAPPAPKGWIRVPAEVSAAARRKRWAAPGVWVAPVAKGSGRQRSYLLGISAGMTLPLHTHRGEELICVLTGAYKDRGHVHHPGDFAENGEDVEHRSKIMGKEACVSLVCADGPLIPRDWVGRLFQPLVGI